MAIKAIPPSASREIGCTTLSRLYGLQAARARIHIHTLALWLHWLVRTAMKWYPYTYAYTRTEQYCGVAYCPAEDVDIIRSTIAYFMDLTHTHERSPTFIQWSPRIREISEILLSRYRLVLPLISAISSRFRALIPQNSSDYSIAVLLSYRRLLLSHL